MEHMASSYIELVLVAFGKYFDARIHNIFTILQLALIKTTDALGGLKTANVKATPTGCLTIAEKVAMFVSNSLGTMVKYSYSMISFK